MIIKPSPTQLGDRNKISESQFGNETILKISKMVVTTVLKSIKALDGSYNTPPVNLPTPKCPQGQHGMLTKIKLKTKIIYLNNEIWGEVF